MATLTESTGTGIGVFTPTTGTLTSSDTLVYSSSKRQLLLLDNTSGGSLTATIDGDGGTTVSVDGYGSVSVASGLAIVVPNNEKRAVVLNTIRHYLQGTVTISGASGLKYNLISL